MFVELLKKTRYSYLPRAWEAALRTVQGDSTGAMQATLGNQGGSLEETTWEVLSMIKGSHRSARHPGNENQVNVSYTSDKDVILMSTYN